MTNQRTGERQRKPKVRFDARYRVDGFDFRKTFDQKGWADAFANELKTGYAQGWRFDPVSRRFLDPSGHEHPSPLSVVDHLTDYLQRRWPNWQPATRRNNQLELVRAALHLLRDGAPTLASDDLLAADAYLRRAVLVVPAAPEAVEDDERWRAWFAQWSQPLSEVTDRHLQDFLDHVRTVGPDGARRDLAPSSIARTRAVVRAAFTNARKRRLIEWDPWEAVEAPQLRDQDRVDPDMVMTPGQIMTVAARCAEHDPRWEALILLQGMCGLRPGESLALRARDIRWQEGRPVEVTVRATHSSLPDRFFADGETRRRPLKGRGEKATRTVPTPPPVADALRCHPTARTARDTATLLFGSSTGAPLHLSNFHRDVWKPVKAATFAEGDPLRVARLHDLRHAAITTWLNAGVPLKTAQTWSGHKTLSVLLDTYLGVMRGDEALARTRLANALRQPGSG